MLFIHRHYRNSGTSSFLEHYSQRLSAANVMHGAAEGSRRLAVLPKTVSLASAALMLECEARVGSRALMDAPVDTYSLL